MCRHGDTVAVELTIPAKLSHSGRPHRKTVGVDRCIAPIVKALNDAGIATTCSCWGHGQLPGRISLADGRELIVGRDFDWATAFFNLFYTDMHGRERPHLGTDRSSRPEEQ